MVLEKIAPNEVSYATNMRI